MLAAVLRVFPLSLSHNTVGSSLLTQLEAAFTLKQLAALIVAVTSCQAVIRVTSCQAVIRLSVGSTDINNREMGG